MKRRDPSLSVSAPVVGRGCYFATVEFEPSDIHAIETLCHRLNPPGSNWVHPKRAALEEVLRTVHPGETYRLAISGVGDQADPGRAVAEALELVGDLESFEVIHGQVSAVERRHKTQTTDVERRHKCHC